MSHKEKVEKILSKASEIIVDKPEVLKLCLSCLLAGGHLLIEDRPGVGKTSLLKTLAKLMGLSSQRVQFTNDLLPADIIGTQIFNQTSHSFEFHQGPLFANFVLADEINRASPKTQSACLQAMEEGRVTVDRESHQLPEPFFLVATQNPLESVGTFALPDSQLDRFLLRLQLGLPDKKSERDILTGRDRNLWIEELEPVVTPQEVIEMNKSVEEVHVSESALDYLQDIIDKTRQISHGLSTRGARDYYRAAKGYAFVSGRDFVVPEDYQKVGVGVMAHRLFGGSHKSGVDQAQEILFSVPVP